MPEGLFDISNVVPQPQPQKPKFSALAVLSALIPIAMAKGGRAGVTGLLHGMEQARRQREEASRDGRRDALAQRRYDLAERQYQSDEDYRQQVLEGNEATRRRLEEGQKSELVKTFNTELGNAESDEDVRALLTQYLPLAQAVGLRPDALESFALRTATPTRLQERRALSKVGQLKSAHGDDWFDTVSGFGTVEMDGERIAPEELVRRAGLGGVDTEGRLVAVPKNTKPVETFAELFPTAAKTPFGDKQIPRRTDGSPDYSAAVTVAEKNGWLPRDPGNQQLARNRDVTFIRQQIHDAVAGGGKGMSALRRKYRARLESYGLDIDAIIRAEVETAKQRAIDQQMQRSRFLEGGGDEQAIGEIERQFDAALENDTPPAPGGLAPGVEYDYIPGRGLVPRGR